MRQTCLTSILFIVLLTACSSSSLKWVQESIDAIGDAWVPDGREGWNYVSVSNYGKGFLLKGEVNQHGHKSEIISFFQENNLPFTDSLTVLPDTTLEYQGLVNVSFANMRRKPSHSAELVSQAIMGTPVLILKSQGGWRLIQTPDDYIAWVTSSSVVACGQERMVAWRSSPRLIVDRQHACVFDDRDESAVVCDLVLGSILVYSKHEGQYLHVGLPDGRQGFVRSDEVRIFEDWVATTTPTAGNLVSYARAFMGLPYLWGGTSANGLDCSGFVKTVYFMNGVILARDASQQIRYGESLDQSHPEDFLTGDLLFFGDTLTNRVTHVGMSLGNGEFIHESGMVHTNSFDSTKVNYSEYYRKTLLGARRMMGWPSQKGAMAVANHPWYLN